MQKATLARSFGRFAVALAGIALGGCPPLTEGALDGGPAATSTTSTAAAAGVPEVPEEEQVATSTPPVSRVAMALPDGGMPDAIGEPDATAIAVTSTIGTATTGALAQEEAPDAGAGDALTTVGSIFGRPVEDTTGSIFGRPVPKEEQLAVVEPVVTSTPPELVIEAMSPISEAIAPLAGSPFDVAGTIPLPPTGLRTDSAGTGGTTGAIFGNPTGSTPGSGGTTGQLFVIPGGPSAGINGTSGQIFGTPNGTTPGTGGTTGQLFGTPPSTLPPPSPPPRR